MIEVVIRGFSVPFDVCAGLVYHHSNKHAVTTIKQDGITYCTRKDCGNGRGTQRS